MEAALGWLEDWQEKLDVWEYDVELVPILPEQVVFVGEFKKSERYFVGIYVDHKNLKAEIYHDRALAEDDIVHELLHLKFPDMEEVDVVLLTDLLL